MLAPHQSEAVDRILVLLRTRRGAILADDVGVGKSFVAAAVMAQFREADLIVPAALVRQWRETLEAFEVRAQLMTHDALLSDAHYPQPDDHLVVVDEAHAFRNPQTRRYAALGRRTAGARILLVTATPVCNGIGDLEALLRLIAADDLLRDVGVPSIDAAFERRDSEAIAAIVGALVVRRDRTVLPPELQFGELERRVVRHPVPDLRAIDQLQFPLVEGRPMLRRFLWRRLESSEAAFLESLRRQVRFYERALAALAAGRALPKRHYRAAFAHEEDADSFQEILFWDLFAPPGEADPQAVRDEIARIRELLRDPLLVSSTKRSMLLALLREIDEPTLIFTGSAATARDLHAALPRSGLVTSRERSRDAVLDALCKGALDVVVSTDMAAEGLNLQRVGVVVHYDIPWNPVKLDQRNGRAHRIGQKRERVRAVYFLPDRRETRIVATVARKNRIRRAALLQSEAEPIAQPTLRPRLTSEAAVARFPPPWPAPLLRRHKAGIEQLIAEMAGEFLDERRLQDLLALVDLECRP